MTSWYSQVMNTVHRLWCVSHLIISDALQCWQSCQQCCGKRARLSPRLSSLSDIRNVQAPIARWATQLLLSALMKAEPTCVCVWQAATWFLLASFNSSIGSKKTFGSASFSHYTPKLSTFYFLIYSTTTSFQSGFLCHSLVCFFVCFY